MKKRDIKNNFRKGAASFYVVAFSTLILVIVVTSFAAIIISEIARTSNDDLSQSAYDSALAGVEDAKLAFYSYQKCKDTVKDEGTWPRDDTSGPLSCEQIVGLVEGGKEEDGSEKSKPCNMVGWILGRLTQDGEEVLIQESSEGGNNMQQAYTCVTLRKDLSDYKDTLSEGSDVKVVQAKFKDIEAKDIKSVRISWFSDADKDKIVGNNGELEKEKNYVDLSNSSAGINSNDDNLVPTIALGMIQTAGSFNLSDFEKTASGQTDRGLLYLVPINKNSEVSGGDGRYTIANDNSISADGFVKSNNREVQNKPYVVKCGIASDSNYVCSALVKLPEPIGGIRNDDTFMFIVSSPYGRAMDFSLEFYTDPEGKGDSMTLDGVQVSIDSTGRANDLYRRVEVRLSAASSSVNGDLVRYALELGDGSGEEDVLQKNITTIKEFGL